MSEAALRIIGYRRDGSPIWPIAGGSDTPPADSQPDDSGDTPGEPDEPQDSDTDPDPSAEASKWKSLARKHEAQAKKNADAARRLAEIEDANKSEIQKAADKAAEAEKRAEQAEAKALRFEVATDKGVPKHLHRFLTGTTQEELEEQADALLEAVNDGNGDTPRAGGRPREAMRSGAASDDDPDPTDMNALLRAAVRGE